MVAHNALIVLFWLTPWVIGAILGDLIVQFAFLKLALVGMWLLLLLLPVWIESKIEPVGGSYDSPIILIIIPIELAAVCWVARYIRKSN